MKPRAASPLVLGLLLVLTLAAPAVSGAAGEVSVPPELEAIKYACGSLLRGTAHFVSTVLDPLTGLPYDQLRCDCRHRSDRGVCLSSGVIPQLADGDIIPFNEDPGEFLNWSFVDVVPGGEPPTLFYALELAPRFSPGNRFAGLIWGATVDLRRYDRLRLRYRTSTPTSRFELKLNSGLPGDVREVTVELAGTPADGRWIERTLEIAEDFPGTQAAHLNFIVLATSEGVAGQAEPRLWLDHLAFLADPARTAECDVPLEPGPGAYPDLARFEPLTGAVNIANALSLLSLLPEASRLERPKARLAVEKILSSLAATPRRDGFMQDWHSPASLMPDPRNRIASLTDLPQLVAALMVVEIVWPELAPEASALREGIVDFSRLFDPAPDGACPGTLRWAHDLCAGRREGPLLYFGNDTLLGEALAIASGEVPASFWSGCLARQGCELRGEGSRRWYTTGAFDCAEHEIPAAETGGPFLQLAALLYLDAERLPVGSLSLGDSAYAMLAAQAEYAESEGLEVWGWANHSDPTSCDYLTCQDFTPAQATPYICAMGLDLEPGPLQEPISDGRSCWDNLLAFHETGADAPFVTGLVEHDFGLRDAWNQGVGRARHDAFLYLDTGWAGLGLLNACRGDLVRKTFASHRLAASLYAALDGRAPVCP